MQGKLDIGRSVEELRRQTFVLIQHMSAGTMTAADRRAIVDLQRIAYELGSVEAQLDSRLSAA